MSLDLTGPLEPASREFTDRDEPRALFDDALAQRSGDYRILVWHGVGGQGKTALRNEFQRRIQRQRAEMTMAVSVLDFDLPRHRSAVDAMLHVRLELGRNRLVRFPTFDLALAHLFELEHPGEDIRQRYPALFRNQESELLTDLLEFVEDTTELLPIPGAKLLYKYGDRLMGRLREWWDQRAVKTHVGEIQSHPANKLRERLPSYLGFDLCRGMTGPNAPRVVLMIDAYEALWRDTHRGALQNLRTDNWVRSLVEHAPGVLVAIFCRDKLRWDELNDKWKGRLEQHLLGGLSHVDAVRFLTRAGIASAEVRERIVTAAQGLPFYLDLALDQFEALKAKGREPVAGDFADTPGEVLERFLDHLSDAEVDDLRMASYSEEIDEQLLGELCRHLHVGRADWARLTQRSYVTPVDDGRMTLHAVMRETLQVREQRLRPGFYNEAHKYLFERCDTIAQSAGTARNIREIHEHALLEAARHLAAWNPQRSAAWILEPQWRMFYEAGRWRALSDAFELISDKAEIPPAADRLADAIWFNHHYAHVCQFLGRNAEARDLYERARRNYPQNALRTADPDYATILHALADVSTAMGDEDGAEPLYAEAMKIYEAAPATHTRRYAYALFSLARRHDANGREADADTHYQRARELFEKRSAEAPNEYAGFLLELGRARRNRRRDDEAEALFKDSLAVYDRPGGNRDGYAAVLVELSMCLSARGNRESAETEFSRAIAVYEEALGPEHPNLGRALHLQAAFWLDDDGRRASAIPQLERATEILKESLGDHHAWTRAARADLGRLQGAVRWPAPGVRPET